MEVATLELIADVSETQERFGVGAGGRGEEVTAVERVVATGADDQVRRVCWQVSELFAYAPRPAFPSMAASVASEPQGNR
jgi:hypothetical protein